MSIVNRDTPLGFELPPYYSQLTLEKFGAGSGTKTIHNDEEAAKREGLPFPVSVGPQTVNGLFQMMLTYFGEGWICGGKSDMTFRRMVPATEFITCRAVLVAKELEGSNIRFVFDAWVENSRGDKVIVGRCSALL